MKGSRSSVWLVIALLLMAGAVAPASAQQRNTCAALVESTLATVAARCAPTGRNQACYGNDAIQALPQASFGGRFSFEDVGDRVNVAEVGTLRLGEMDLDAGDWGVALVRLQADLPAQPADQYVTLLIFGDVEVTNAVDYATLPPPLIDVFAKQNVRVRQGPSTNTAVVGGLITDQAVTADGRLADGTWIRIRLPGTGDWGWVFSDLVTGANLNMLKIVDPDATPEPVEAEPEGPAYGPMQAFTFSAGTSAPPCPEAASGLLIQTPGTGQDVTLVVNGVTLQLASTAYAEMAAAEMTIDIIEGAAQVTALDVTHIVSAGARVRVPLDEDLLASAPPEAPEPYDAGALEALPLAGLAREVEVAPALSQSEIDALDVVPRAGVWEVTLGDEALSCSNSRERFPPFPEEPYPAAVHIEAGGTRLVWGETRYTRLQPSVYEALGSFEFRGETVTYANTVRVVQPDRLDAEMVFTTGDGCTLRAAAAVAYPGDAD